MLKMVLVCLVVVALACPVMAADKVTVTSQQVSELGSNVYLANVKVKRGPFGGGFLGTDAGWILYQQDAGKNTVLASGNGRFDGTNVVAAIAGGATLGAFTTWGMSLINNSVKSTTNAVNSTNTNLNANLSQVQHQLQGNALILPKCGFPGR